MYKETTRQLHYRMRRANDSTKGRATGRVDNSGSQVWSTGLSAEENIRQVEARLEAIRGERRQINHQRRGYVGHPGREILNARKKELGREEFALIHAIKDLRAEKKRARHARFETVFMDVAKRLLEADVWNLLLQETKRQMEEQQEGQEVEEP